MFSTNRMDFDGWYMKIRVDGGKKHCQSLLDRRTCYFDCWHWKRWARREVVGHLWMFQVFQDQFWDEDEGGSEFPKLDDTGTLLVVTWESPPGSLVAPGTRKDVDDMDRHRSDDLFDEQPTWYALSRLDAKCLRWFLVLVIDYKVSYRADPVKQISMMDMFWTQLNRLEYLQEHLLVN